MEIGTGGGLSNEVDLFWDKMNELLSILGVEPPIKGTPFWHCGPKVQEAIDKVKVMKGRDACYLQSHG